MKKMIKWIDWGRDNYAGVTWSNIPEATAEGFSSDG